MPAVRLLETFYVKSQGNEIQFKDFSASEMLREIDFIACICTILETMYACLFSQFLRIEVLNVTKIDFT